MKKLLILSAVLVSGAFVANADSDTTKTATIGVNVADVKTIEIVSGDNPLFTLATADDYNNAATTTGIESDVETNFKVVSRGGYKVKAKLEADLTTSATGAGSKTIPGSAIGIRVNGTPTASSGEATPTPNTTNRPFAVGGSELGNIITTPAATGGTRGTTFNVAYTMKNFENVVNLAVGNFTSTIVYTIEAN